MTIQKKSSKAVQSKRTKQSQKPKRISLKQVVQKVKDVVAPKKKKLPFGGKCGRKKRVGKKLNAQERAIIDGIREDEKIEKQQCEEHGESFASGTSSVGVNGFFYTDEKFIDSFEDTEILQTICQVHPLFMQPGCDEMKARMEITKVFEDENLIQSILEKYNMNMVELLQFMFRQDSSVFTKQFAKKLNSIIYGKSYFRNGNIFARKNR